MDKKIINGYVAEYENGAFRAVKKDFFVIGGRISFNGGTDEYEVIDAKDRLIMPGLINLHTHAYMSIFRNYADDVSFDEWLFKRIMPVEDVIEREDAYWMNMLGMIEMIETGTTCFSDMHMFEGQSCRAARDAGMRAFIGRGLVGSDINGDGAGRIAETFRERAEFESDTIKFILSPHAIYSCSEKLYAQVAELAAREGLLKQTHISESVKEVEDCYEKNGISPVELLDRAGFLDDKCILAHCVQVSGDDIELIRSRGAAVVTNPASNAKLGNGIAPIKAFRESGANICIGTDGCSSNNTLNMFREMSLLSLMHKGLERDCTFLSANDVLSMATVNAARALGMEGSLGIISEGACADLIFIDLTASSLFPNNDMITALCYSANGSEVASVMVNGKLLMKDRELLTIDRQRVMSEVGRIAKKYL
jgi:5-methylthioadenosine/S-adenosylhomocysteine deaminase